MALPDLNLLATVNSNGSTYGGWESIEIWREVGSYWSYMKLTCAEDTDTGYLPPGFSLNVGDQCDGYLCGVQVIAGIVAVRQVAYNKGIHAVEILVASKTQSLGPGCVPPGQYIQQDAKQIITSVAGAIGIGVQFLGDMTGVDLPFERVAVHIGERIIDFISRLAVQRNLHITDNPQGDLVMLRGDASQGSSAASLQEGKNIESARMVMSILLSADPVTIPSQIHGTDPRNGTQSSEAVIQGNVPGYIGPERPNWLLNEMPIQKTAELQQRFNYEVSTQMLETFEVTITTAGWLMDSGQLWITQVGLTSPVPITIMSPMLLPRAGGLINQLAIKGVKHLQDSDEGTRTEITCCLARAIGGADAAAIGTGSNDTGTSGVIDGGTPLGQGGIGHQ